MLFCMKRIMCSDWKLAFLKYDFPSTTMPVGVAASSNTGVESRPGGAKRNLTDLKKLRRSMWPKVWPEDCGGRGALENQNDMDKTWLGTPMILLID